MKERGGKVDGVQQTLATLITFLGDAGSVGKINSGAFRELAKRFGKVDFLHLHLEGEDVAAFAAAEAMEILGIRKDDERRCFFLMERAEPFVGSAGFLERRVGADEFDNIGSLANLRDRIMTHGVCPRLNRPVSRHEETLKSLDRKSIGHAGNVINHEAGQGIRAGPWLILDRHFIRMLIVIGAEFQHDMLRTNRVWQLVQWLVHALEQKCTQRIRGFEHFERHRDFAWGRLSVGIADDVDDQRIDPGGMTVTKPRSCKGRYIANRDQPCSNRIVEIVIDVGDPVRDFEHFAFQRARFSRDGSGDFFVRFLNGGVCRRELVR